MSDIKNIVLLTDFGLKDNYVGVMKGVITGINPAANIIDLTHSIEPQNVEQAAFTIANSYEYFPEGTIFTCVTDPGVGSKRRILAAYNSKFIFVAPDNGVLSFLIDSKVIESAVEVTNTEYMLSEISSTFHGRDIFAPVSAHLSKGTALSSLGNPFHLENAVKLNGIYPEIIDQVIKGKVIDIDNFGNLISNIHIDTLKSLGATSYVIEVSGLILEGRYSTFSDAVSGELLSYTGSSGYLEIAVRNGNASEKLSAVRGEQIILKAASDE